MQLKMSMPFNFKQPAGRSRVKRRFCLMLVILALSLLSTHVLLQSLNIKWGSGIVPISGVRPKGKAHEPIDFDYFPDDGRRSKEGDEKNRPEGFMLDDSKGRWNNMPKGLFISKLRQQQAKLIRMNYHAMMYPMNKPMFPFDEAQSLRRNVVANVCTSLEENAYGAKPPIPGHLLVDDNHHLIFCQIRKVASITWRQVLEEAANKPSSHEIKRLITYTKAERDYRLKHYTKIMFVREPILRIVSGWYDKFVRTNDRDQLNYLMRFGCDIARRSGKNISDFKLCLRDELDDDDGELSGPDLFSRLKEARRLRISFDDFARYLINGPVAIKNDMHWETYHSRCQPCQVDYDFIGHYETIANDAHEMMRRVGLSKDVFPFPASRSNSEEIAREVLSALDPLLLMRLSELYHLDYQLFGYNLRKLQEWLDQDLDSSLFNKNY